MFSYASSDFNDDSWDPKKKHDLVTTSFDNHPFARPEGSTFVLSMQ